MKYKVGERIKIIKATAGCYGANEKIGTVTNKPSTDGLCNYQDGFNVDCGDKHVWRIGLESECELLDELTAEEAIILKSEMCGTIVCSKCKCSKENNGEDISCNKFIKKYPERCIENLKQWKKDHKKKEVEVEFVDVIRIIEDTGDIKRCVHEERIDVVFSEINAEIKRVLKDWYKDHDGEFFAVMESRCVVKE